MFQDNFWENVSNFRRILAQIYEKESARHLFVADGKRGDLLENHEALVLQAHRLPQPPAPVRSEKQPPGGADGVRGGIAVVRKIAAKWMFTRKNRLRYRRERALQVSSKCGQN